MRAADGMIVRSDTKVTAQLLENPGKLPLQLIEVQSGPYLDQLQRQQIEVQSGPYLGEDDIVRITDNYGRA